MGGASERVVLVSDLHLGAGAVLTPCGSFWDDLFDGDGEFEAFASWLVETGASRIVLLGDTIDFHRVPLEDAAFARDAPQAIDQLDRVARSHPRVFGALQRLIGAGLSVDVVVGNHDVELARPEVQARFAALVGRHGWSGAAPSESLRFHNWFLYLPGLLYAEHGNHYHDINSFDRPLHPFVADRVERPLAARLNSARLLLRARKHCRPKRRALLTDLAPGHRASRRLRQAYRRQVLPRYAEQLDLPAEVVDALHQLGSATTLSTARRVIAFRLSRSGRHSFRSDAPRVAAAVLDLLRSADRAVPFCVFGHAHAARAVLFGDGRGGYLNCGTWCTDQRRHSRDAHTGEGLARRIWVEVACSSCTATSATLWQWVDGPTKLSERPAFT